MWGLEGKDFYLVLWCVHRYNRGAWNIVGPQSIPEKWRNIWTLRKRYKSENIFQQTFFFFYSLISSCYMLPVWILSHKGFFLDVSTTSRRYSIWPYSNLSKETQKTLIYGEDLIIAFLFRGDNFPFFRDKNDWQWWHPVITFIFHSGVVWGFSLSSTTMLWFFMTNMKSITYKTKEHPYYLLIFCINYLENR